MRGKCRITLLLTVTIVAAFATQLSTTTAEANNQNTYPSGSKQPNILIILADDLGWGDVSFHGSAQIPTPNIDLLASSGVVLNNYYVSPICSPSRSALLTGYYPIHTGMQVGVIAASTPYGLPLQFPTLGQHFRSLGYATHLVGKWHQGMFAWDRLPTRRGFDTYFGYLTGHSDYLNRTGGDHWYGYDFREMEARANLSRYAGRYSTDMYADRVVELIERHAQQEPNSSKPFMIYFAEQSVHSGTFRSVQPPARFENKFTWIADEKRRNFAGMVEALDESIGRVFRSLNETGLLDNTIILFSNDNGGATGNGRGQFIDNSIGSNFPLKGSKYTLWEGGVRGTAFLWTSQLERPYVSGQLMHLVDVLPTLYAAAGGNVSQLGPIDGMNLWPTLMNATSVNSTDDHPVRDHLLHNIDHREAFWAVRYHNFKLTSGSWNAGRWDVWYEAPGQSSESADWCYECSDVYKVLKSRNQLPSSVVTIKIDCNAAAANNTLFRGSTCQAAGQNNDEQFCLFDLERDPCEMDNIAEQYPNVVKKLYSLYVSYNATYAKPENRPSDSRANPALHGGWWTPWQ